MWKCFSMVMVVLIIAAPAFAQIKPTIIPAAPPLPPEQQPSVVDAAKRAAIKPIVASKIILVGDSTTQVGSGWGSAFCANHISSYLTCVNLARGGRGTFDYRAEGSWDIALGEMKTPGYAHVYVLIQFGHNDQPGKPGRTTDLYTEYPANLARYVREARAAGAIPVLVTPLTRRMFKGGSLQDDLEPWAQAVRKVAADMQVPLVDLHALSVQAVQAMGPEAALSLSQSPPPPELIEAARTGTTIPAPKSDPASKPATATSTEVLETPQSHPSVAFDYTHLGPKGAEVFAREITLELARVVPDLRGVLVDHIYALPGD